MAGGGGAKKRKMKISPFKVLPDFLKRGEENQILCNWLDDMGCTGLMLMPWGAFTNNNLATELEENSDDRYDNSLRAHPEH